MLNFVMSLYRGYDMLKYKDAGVGSVVVHVKEFSLRGIDYFSYDEFKIIHEETRTHGIQMYVDMTCFFTEDEMYACESFLQYVKKLDVDGIYFGDEGILEVAIKLKMEDKLMYHPDTLITNANDVLFYLDEGLKAVILAKELSFEEILEMADQLPNKKIESFIHGRQTMMHSKRTLLSNYFSFLKKDYEVKGKQSFVIQEEQRREEMPIMEDQHGTHMFSGFSLMSFHEIKDLVKHGISQFRVEGLFFDEAMSLQAIRDYHAVLNGAKTAEECILYYTKDENPHHFTSGYYYDKTSVRK